MSGDKLVRWIHTILRKWSLKNLSIFVLLFFICFSLLITFVYWDLSLTTVSSSTITERTPSKATDRSCLFPECNSESDRILEQLYYQPKVKLNQTFTILLTDPLKIWSVAGGHQQFLDDECPLQNCFITDDKLTAKSADAVLFRNELEDLMVERPPHQIWIIYLLESPLNSKYFSSYSSQINWTASYRFDSDLVIPYGKFVTFDELKKFTHAKNISHYRETKRNFAEGKKRKVSWFVSNCNAKNRRFEYAKQLAKYIRVDIFGRCSDKGCPHGSECLEMIKKNFKFYLSFENSNCRDYITEKLYINALQNDVVPIVMGATRKQYELVAPRNSFIHVEEFKTPKLLARYLKLLDRNDTGYNEYFQWKSQGRWINTKFWCRLCAMLNNPRPKIYQNFEDWWRHPGTCVKDHWK